ncbi:MAG: GntR family transcriptional regulator [Oscillospiraceae bacterium]|jgi:GntR family transcriptional regulator of arabinose operon
MDDFKYLTIVEWVKKYITDERLSSGERFYSEKELCDIHNVSRQTVRQALMVLEGQNIIWRKRGSGTFVKAVKNNTARNNFNVGVISTYFSDYIFPSIVTGIERVLRANNVGMQLSITHNQVFEESQALKTMLTQNIKGLIVEPSKSALPNPNMSLYKEISSLNIPLVFFNAKYPWSNFPCVAMDDVMAGRMATDHLFDLGHRKISGIFTLDDIQGHKRYQGFINSFEHHNILTAEQNVLWFSTSEKHALFTLSKDRINTLLSNSTAVVCYNDDLAVSLLDFCKKERIRVPDDISIVGIDDSKLAAVCKVPLTTVRHPHQLLGERAAEKLLEIISNPSLEANNDVLFSPELVTRNSAIKAK